MSDRDDGNPNRRCAHGKLFTESCPGCGYVHPRDRGASGCPKCNGEGFTIGVQGTDQLAPGVRRLRCHCTTYWPPQPTTKPHDPEGIDR